MNQYDGSERPGVTKRGAARTAVWSAVENGGLAIVSFASLVVYSRFLSPSDFGLFSIVLSFVELVGVLVTHSFHDALVQKPELTRAHFDAAFTATLVLSLALLAGCVLFAPVFATAVGHPEAGTVLAWTSLWFPCTALSATIVPWQRRKLEVRSLAVRSLVGRLSGAVIGIVLVVLGAGLWGLVAQYVLVALAGSVVLWLLATERPRLRFGARELRSLLGFGALTVGAMLVNIGIGRLFTIVVGISLGTQAAGYLNLAFRAVDVFWNIAASAVSQTAFTVFARLQLDDDRLRRAYASAVEFTSLALYPCFIGIALVAPELVELLFGARWLASVPYVQALGWLIVLRAPRQLGRPLLTAVGRPQDGLAGLVAELILVAALLALTGARSLPWAIAIWVAREVLSFPIVLHLVKRATGIGYVAQIGGARSALVSALFMAATVSLARVLPVPGGPGIRLALLASAGGAAYAGAAWLVDRRAVVAVWDFVLSAARRRAGRLAET
jgi:O-antigen/teichoic acid export membrane protein